MDLYRIILVDDEAEVRESIIKKINWQEAGFQVVGDAENGEEALELVSQLEPDVVLSDIKMPYMDGLTLAERIKQKYPSIKMVIFSGFDEFEYAKKAIQLNIIEYILKPVNVEELTGILKKIKKNLDEEIAQKRNVELLRENYKKSLPIIREQFLNELIRRKVSAETITDRMREYEINLLAAKKWVVAAVNIETPEAGEEGSLSLHQERELIPISVRQMIKQAAGRYCRCVTFTSSWDMELVLISAIDENNSQTGLIDVLGDLCKEIKRVLKVPVTIGIGQSCTALTGIPGAYQSAREAVGYKTAVGTGTTIYIHDMEPVTTGKLLWESGEEARLFSAIKFGPPDKIEQTVRDILDHMEEVKVHASQHQAYMLSVTNSVIQLMQQYDLELNTVMGAGIGAAPSPDASAFWSGMKKEDFGPWLRSAALGMNKLISQEREDSRKRLIEQAKEYISENYTDPELSVEKICRHLHMSPAYFSTIFKKETGQAYISYLTDMRLNKAVELLTGTADKTYVIAAKVGYQEQNYFSYVFKKKFGISPTKYRGVK